MKKNSGHNKKIFIFCAIFAVLVSALIVIPQVSQAAEFELFPGELESLGKEPGTEPDYRVFIQNFYRFAIAASILVATVMIMIGGIIWITSAGDQARVGKAREYIINSIIGVVLLMGAYVILAVINPNLVELKKPDIPILQPPGCCVIKNASTSETTEDTTKDETTKKDQTESKYELVPNKETCTKLGSEDFREGITCSEVEAEEKGPVGKCDDPPSPKTYNCSTPQLCTNMKNDCNAHCENAECGVVFKKVDMETKQEDIGTFLCICSGSGSGSATSVADGSCTSTTDYCKKEPMPKECCVETTSDACERLKQKNPQENYTFRRNQDCTGASSGAALEAEKKLCENLGIIVNPPLALTWSQTCDAQCTTRTYCRQVGGKPKCVETSTLTSEPDVADFWNPLGVILKWAGSAIEVCSKIQCLCKDSR